MQKLVKIISTFFYLGYLPLIPGTYASISAVLLFLLLRNDFRLYLTITALIAVCGFCVCGKAEEIFAERDSPKIVIDEVCGMLLCFLFVPFNVINLLVGFVLFRIFDIVKIPPARKIEKIKGGLGIMLDDIVAAFYTNICLQFINYFLSCSFL